MEKNFIHVDYCSFITDLTEFLRKIHPSELITVTAGNGMGYTVVWKSDKEFDFR